MASSFVPYYRVSTGRQGHSRLGLDAQRPAVREYLGGNPEDQLVAEHTEIESGKRADRPELQSALAACKRHKATLIIAKLDRLARNVAFIANLMESGVEFRRRRQSPCLETDAAHAGCVRGTRAGKSAPAQRPLSPQPKPALAAAKARGVMLGSQGRILAAQNKLKADEFAESIAGAVRSIRERGITTVRAIRDELNRQGISSASGRTWHITTVFRLFERIDAGLPAA
jgi:hypothetical protein